MAFVIETAQEFLFSFDCLMLAVALKGVPCARKYVLDGLICSQDVSQ